MERNLKAGDRSLKLSQVFVFSAVLIFLFYCRATVQKPTLNDAGKILE
jgi:hypothetical protein